LFVLYWTDSAKESYNFLKNHPSEKKQYKAVKKCIQLLAANPRHPGLHTHEFKSLKGPDGRKIFEAYAQQNTPGAYRVFWFYGPDETGKDKKRIPVITILAIVPHPDD
jgi:hypothetical protein